MFNPEKYEHLGVFYLGRGVETPDEPLLYDSRDLTTHAVCVGMTGSGKTGLCIDLLEEALLDGVPAIVIDPKGDISNLLLTFPQLRAEDFAPWVEKENPAAVAARWRDGLARWGQGPDRIRRFRDAGELAVYTPGSSAGRMVSILGSLEAPSASTLADPEAFAERVSGTTTSLLSLLGIDADPLQSSEHVFLANLLRYFWHSGRGLDLATLIRAIQSPPFDRIGVMELDTVFGSKDRAALAMRMNNLIAAPSFAPWLEGDPLDVQAFLRSASGKPKISIFSIAHLADAERMFFVSLLLGRVLDWMRQQSGTSSLRALFYMDEIFGYLPPVANPPSKTPLLTMLKQGRAFGLGVVLATQNPVDVDYKALSNAGTWFLGRLQTEQDVERVLDGLLSAPGTGGLDRQTVKRTLANLQSRQFLMQNAHEDGPLVFETRWALSYLRGPMTKEDIRRLTRGQQPPAPLIPAAVEDPPAQPASSGTRAGQYLPVRVPGKDDTLVWRPMVYGEGRANVVDRRLGIDEFVHFGLIRGLQGGTASFAWSDSAQTKLEPTSFRDQGESGEHLPVEPVAESPTTWESWKRDLVSHAAATTTARAFVCPPLRLQSDPNETEAAFRARVDHAIREKRDAAMGKLRERYHRKVDRLEEQLGRTRDGLQRQQDQARDAQVNAALNVGEALLGVFGGRRRRVSTSKATRVVREQREVSRAAVKVQDLVSDLYDAQAEMEAALADEAEKFDADAFPIEVKQAAVSAKDVEITYCGLVWVPYWTSPDGKRRRAF